MPEAGQDILVLNSGSSSLKFAVFREGSQDEEMLCEGSADGIGRDDGSLRIAAADGTPLVQRDHLFEGQGAAFQALAAAISSQHHLRVGGIGHRIVHGGPKLREHQQLTPTVQQELALAKDFAPLHIPTALRLIQLSMKAFASVRQFVCFDTAFHRTMPEVATRLPLPSRFHEQGIMRYGFHGLSYESIVHRLGKNVPARAVFAHLGNGASVTAVRNGHSIDTSMGFTPTGGVVMGTRSGDLDPGTLLYILRKTKQTPDELEALVDKQSGLAALSNGESDMRLLLKGAAAGDPTMKLAIDCFCIAVRKQIGAYAALLGGLDLLVFTGGIGEHADEVRARIMDGLEFLGIEPNSEKVRVLKSEEDLQIARHTRVLLEKSHQDCRFSH